MSEAFKVVNKVEEAKIKAIYEASRLQTMFLLNIHLKPQHQFRKPQDLYTFSWEAETTKITDWRQMKDLFKALATKKIKKNG